MKKNIRTDLALEAREIGEREAGKIKGITASEKQEKNIKITEVNIISPEGEKALGKAQGRYITFEAPTYKYDEECAHRLSELIADEIKLMGEIDNKTTILVVGLGNRAITPDALGAEVTDKLFITNHMKDFFNGKTSSVCAIAPGVLGTTGIETVEIIKSLCQKINPDLIIAVDALAAAELDRLSSTVQIADTGIQPGAGVGNDRKGLNRQTLGMKVIAIGVPTVIDASNISNIEIPKNMSPLMVTTKDIDTTISAMSKIISDAINMATCNI